MDKGIGLLAGLAALFALGSAHAACPGSQVMVYTDINDATGHVFEVYKANGISWADAAACAAANSPISGATGHLATITSFSENQWIVDQLLAPALSAATPLTQSQVWVGGVQDASATSLGGGWRWVNSEGPFSGSNGNPEYTNWAGGEPNDGDGVENGQENHLTVGRYAGNYYAWNDEGAAPGSIGGFIVEYDVPRTAQCTVGVNCETIDGQTLIFPTGSYTTGDTIKFTAYEFNDPRVIAGKCTTRSTLTLFTDAAFGPDAQLRIPPYLCGSPKFVVVAVDSSQLEILKGTVFVENQTTEKVLPDNLYKCFDPILGSLLTGDTRYSPDPQYQDVVVWQSTNPANMLENSTTAPTDYVGAATEATNGCGSTVAKVRGASYFVVGMHIDFGNAAYDYANSPLQNYQQFVALTQYKLSLLQKSVANARAVGSVKNPDGQAMASQVKNAISKLNAGDPAGALTSINQFINKVNSSTYYFPPSVTFNYNGDHLMRGENIRFMLRVKVVPYKPAP